MTWICASINAIDPGNRPCYANYAERRGSFVSDFLWLLALMPRHLPLNNSGRIRCPIAPYLLVTHVYEIMHNANRRDPAQHAMPHESCLSLFFFEWSSPTGMLRCK